VGQGIVEDHPESDTRHQGQDTKQQQAADLIPVPDGLAEEAVGSGMVALLGVAGGFPDPADGPATGTDDPGGDRETKRGMNLDSKSGSQRV
jgi:hypothetical protein